MFLINITFFTFRFSALLRAAGAVSEIQTVCFVNIVFRECKKLILNQVKRASHLVKIIVACSYRLPKLQSGNTQ
jgi:hypothetical protein